MTDPFESFQSDIVGRITNAPFFAPVSVLREDTGLTESDVEQSMAGMTVKGGKPGACAIVFQATEVTKSPNTPGPEVEASVIVRVLEVTEINRSAQGTGLTSRVIATQIEQLCHLWSRASVAVRFKGTKRYNDAEGTIGHDVELVTTISQGFTPRLPPPRVSVAGGIVTLSSNFPGDICYVLGGGFPGLSDSTALLYAAPFAAGPLTLIRAAMYPRNTMPGYMASDIVEFTTQGPAFPSNAVLNEDGSAALNEA